MHYSSEVLQHFHNPNYLGEFSKTDPTVYTGLVGTPERGDVVQIQIKLRDGVIFDARFKAQASVATIAACSWLTTTIIGKSVQQINSIQYEDILQALSLSPLKKHCALIALEGLQQALAGTKF